jgi:hypothetical protein
MSSAANGSRSLTSGSSQTLFVPIEPPASKKRVGVRRCDGPGCLFRHYTDAGVTRRKCAAEQRFSPVGAEGRCGNVAVVRAIRRSPGRAEVEREPENWTTD